jgi:hypothetical protein
MHTLRQQPLPSCGSQSSGDPTFGQLPVHWQEPARLSCAGQGNPLGESVGESVDVGVRVWC